MLLACVAFRQQFLGNAVSDAGLRGRRAHLCNNPEPNLELTVNGPHRQLRFGTIAASTKKGRSGRCGLP
jgi:hypothetical protein